MRPKCIHLSRSMTDLAPLVDISRSATREDIGGSLILAGERIFAELLPLPPISLNISVMHPKCIYLLVFWYSCLDIRIFSSLGR